MKYLLVVFSILSVSFFTHAGTYDVVLKCGMFGSLLEGRLTVPAEKNDWTYGSVHKFKTVCSAKPINNEVRLEIGDNLVFTGTFPKIEYYKSKSPDVKCEDLKYKVLEEHFTKNYEPIYMSEKVEIEGREISFPATLNFSYLQDSYVTDEIRRFSDFTIYQSKNSCIIRFKN